MADSEENPIVAVKRCHVIGCNSDCSDPNIKFFHFPVNRERCERQAQGAYTVHIIHEGYSELVSDSLMRANCTCTLIKGRYNIIVDTMTPWDRNLILCGLKKYGMHSDDIDYVVSTHGHSDHTGNNNLFLKAKKHIVGFSISSGDQYTLHPFDNGEEYVIDDGVSVVPTPGHTGDDVSVLVRTSDLGVVAVAGDLFERQEDLGDPTLWRDIAGSQLPEKQEENRNKILSMVDYIIPGHGPMFKVTQEMRDQQNNK